LLWGCNNYEEVVKVEKEEISFWYGLEGTLGDYVEEIIQDFNNSQDEINVIGHRQGNYSDTLQSLKLAIATNSEPSVALLEQRGIMSLIDLDGLQSLNGLTDGNNRIDLETIPNRFVEIFIKDNQIYSYPMYATVWVTYLRNEYLDQYMPSQTVKSFQDVMTVLIDQKEKGNHMTFGLINEETTLINAVMSKGGQFISDDLTTVLIDDEKWIEVWEQFRIWIYEDKIIRFYEKNLGWDDYYEVLNDVKSGRSIGNISSVSDKDIYDGDEIATQLHLSWNDNDSAPVTYAIGLVIPRLVEGAEKEAAGEWIKYLMNAEVNAKWITKSGYLPGNESAYDTQTYKNAEIADERLSIFKEQLSNTTQAYYDPTGGKINEAVIEAAIRLINDNTPADIVLKEAKEKAQKALDDYNKQRVSINSYSE
jgi:multiple sugar transport system substrate-binding protein